MWWITKVIWLLSTLVCYWNPFEGNYCGPRYSSNLSKELSCRWVSRPVVRRQTIIPIHKSLNICYYISRHRHLYSVCILEYFEWSMHATVRWKVMEQRIPLTLHWKNLPLEPKLLCNQPHIKPSREANKSC